MCANYLSELILVVWFYILILKNNPIVYKMFCGFMVLNLSLWWFCKVLFVYDNLFHGTCQVFIFFFNWCRLKKSVVRS